MPKMVVHSAAEAEMLKYKTTITIPAMFVEVLDRIGPLPISDSGPSVIHRGMKWKSGNPMLPLGRQQTCHACGKYGRVLVTFKSKLKLRLCFTCVRNLYDLLTNPLLPLNGNETPCMECSRPGRIFIPFEATNKHLSLCSAC